MTAKDENKVLELFQNLYPEFPKGLLTKNESPDFLLELGDRKIGIEVTEAFQDSKLQQRSSDHSSFVASLIQRIHAVISFTFIIAVDFSQHFHIKKQRKEELYHILLPLCIQALRNIQNMQAIEMKDFNILPPEIEGIYLYRYDGLTVSYNEKPEGGIVSDFTDKHLDLILHKKHKSLKKYQPCDKYWLIIKAGNYYAGSFDEIKVTLPVQSKFDKIFILRVDKSELVQIK